MKPYICYPFALGLAVFLFAGSCFAAEPATQVDNQMAGDVTYVIPIKDMIERGLVYVIRRGVRQVEREGGGAIIFDMDTPGGRLDATEEIINMIAGLDVETYTFVNPRAISAGAILALATDHIYMAPGGRIGDAMPIMMSPLPFGGPKEMPEGLKEKAVSPTVALIRSAAQRKGHDPELAEAMVRLEMEYKIGDMVICPKDQLLTLTSQDAAQLVGDDNHPLLSSGTVKNMAELLEKIGRSGNRIVTVTMTPAERIARVIDGFPVSGLLLAAGLLCLYIEFKTPGIGVPGMAGVMLLAVWLWGHHVAGLAGMGEMILFMVGMVLIIAEIFVIPGFGIAGISGITMMLAALLLAMVEHYPGGSLLPPMSHVEKAIETLGMALVMGVVGAVILARILPRTRAFEELTLAATIHDRVGLTSVDAQDVFIGRRGLAMTDLHPAGVAQFDDARLDVVTAGNFVTKGSSVIISEIHGNRIVVQPETPLA